MSMHHPNKPPTGPGIYDPRFVSDLFDRMSSTYGITNYLSSFGFSERWRRQCIAQLDWSAAEAPVCYDLMSGMGECWADILRQSQGRAQVIGVDISPEMIKRSRQTAARLPAGQVQIRQENILDNDLATGSADMLISTFGLKTFSEAQLEQLANQISRLLKPGGQFSLLEISAPPNRFLNILFLFYLKNIIPWIGKIFAGDNFSYKMLGVYCARFQDCRPFLDQLAREGLQVEFRTYFFGCATGVVGRK
ncbi:MAG: class I SAM-dependent methyltransferase [Saprospiraceae bacterium]|nr:class I SAM-dependent methyltransferase [Saprospiraceae bacterium]